MRILQDYCILQPNVSRNNVQKFRGNCSNDPRWSQSTCLVAMAGQIGQNPPCRNAASKRICDLATIRAMYKDGNLGGHSGSVPLQKPRARKRARLWRSAGHQFRGWARQAGKVEPDIRRERRGKDDHYAGARQDATYSGLPSRRREKDGRKRRGHTNGGRGGTFHAREPRNPSLREIVQRYSDHHNQRPTSIQTGRSDRNRRYLQK